MNTKTTLVLAVAAALVAGYLFFVEKPWEATQVAEEPKTIAVALYDPAPEDPDRVEVQRRIDGKKLVFVRDAEQKAWKMVEPIEAPATEHQVKQLVDKVTQIKFTRKYGPNDKNRPSDKVSRFDKPIASVRLLKGDKPVADVVVGEDLPTGEGNYLKVNREVKVKVDGKDEVINSEYVLESDTDLSEAFTAKVDTFRDRNVLKFNLADVKRVQVEGDRNYVLVKNGDNWVLESPLRARADKSKAESVARSVSSLYVAEFKDDAPANYATYHLEPARMKVTIESEKTVPPKAKPGDPDTQPADIEPSIEKVQHELLVGGPADAGGKQYFARLGDKPWVFSINESTYSQLAVEVPDLQDKKIASVDSGKVKTIKVDSPEGSLTLTRGAGGTWQDADNVAADSAAVSDLLRAIGDLQATSFVDPASELIAVDWEQPRAKVTLTEEGSLNPVVVLVGPASASGKMVFVRNAAEDAVATVREESVEQLLAGPMAYRDRTVMKFDRSRANRVEITPAGKDTVALVQENENWSMVEPAEAQVDRNAIRNLMQNLSTLQAKRVAGAGDLAGYGLDAPQVTVAAYVEPVTEAGEAKAQEQPAEKAAEEAPQTQPAAEKATTRPVKSIEEQIAQVESLIEYQKTNPDENPLATQMLHEQLAKLKAAQSQPAAATQPVEVAEAPAASEPAAEPAGPEVFRLHLAKKDGKVYGNVDGRDMVYEIDEQVFTDATAEFHDRQITRFESNQVTEVAFIAGETAMVFRKSGEDWKYVQDPVLPIDSSKVTSALDEVKEVSTDRYVSYQADKLAEYGLDAPARKFSVTLDGGQTIELLISDKGPEGDADQGVYAALAGQNKVFLLKPDQVEKFSVELEDFEKTGGNAPAAGGPPPGFGGGNAPGFGGGNAPTF